jgi:hypothetical protein
VGKDIDFSKFKASEKIEVREKVDFFVRKEKVHPDTLLSASELKELDSVPYVKLKTEAKQKEWE